jgi:hypothetical protein
LLTTSIHKETTMTGSEGMTVGLALLVPSGEWTNCDEIATTMRDMGHLGEKSRMPPRARPTGVAASYPHCAERQRAEDYELVLS